MAKIKILSSRIFDIGTKFVVSENSMDSTFSPGTEGFMSYVKGRDRDYPNVVFLKTIITKRGKSGKERIDQGELSTPIFDLDGKDMPGILPDKKRKYYVHIEPINNLCKSVMEMTDIDYLAWANAYARFIYQLNSRSKYISIWPEGSKNLVNRILHIEEYYSEDPEFAKSDYANYDSRYDFINTIRRMESSLVKCCISYKQKIAKLEEAALIDIEKRNKELDLGPKNVVKSSRLHFTSKREATEILQIRHGKNDKSAMKSVTDVLYT